MDPNANLEELMELARLAIEQDCLSVIDTLRLAELIVALDEWIRKDGVLPESWAKPVDSPKRTVLVSGNPFDGLVLWGPFADSEDAGDYAEENKMDQWTAVGIEPVDEDDPTSGGQTPEEAA